MARGRVLCQTCLNVCKREKRNEKGKFCKEYNEFEQLSIWRVGKWGGTDGTTPAPKYQKAPRYSWRYYGITEERKRQLMNYIRSGRYASLASQAAHTANEMITEYILLSVNEKLSYEGLEKLWGRGEIDRIPYCRTDFYGIRRYFFSIFNEKMKEIGK